MMSLFKPAVKHEAKLRLAIAGPSGSGKTYTSLAVATALANGGKVAVLDTEHGSASKYADLFSFDVLNLEAPFHPDRFTEAIKDAANAGYDVIVVDSLSHAWNGSGGALELVEQFGRKYKGNSYAAWGDVTPIQNKLIEAIVGTRIHIIATMRSKQDYILVERNGKQMPQKVGMAPIQRDGFEYEFDVFLDMDIENNAIVSKTRCTALTGKVIKQPGQELAHTLREWLTGEPAPVFIQQRPAPQQHVTHAPNSNNKPVVTSFDDMDNVPVTVDGDKWELFRGKVKENKRNTVQTVCSAVAMTGAYRSETDALNAAMSANADLEKGTQLSNDEALDLFDALYSAATTSEVSNE